MEVLLFHENDDVADVLVNILKEKYTSVMVCNSLLQFLEYISNINDMMNVIFIISENVLNSYNTKIDYLLKNFDYYAPIMTYNINKNVCLNLDVNYIYEYHEKNYTTFMEDIYKIELCFNKFANDEKYFSSHNFYFREVPIYLNTDKKKQNTNALYGLVNEKKDIDITSNLTRMQRKLFMFLLSHTEGATLDEISYNLWRGADKSKAQSVYTLVHTLNHMISQKTSSKCQIIHKNRKYQLIHHADI